MSFGRFREAIDTAKEQIRHYPHPERPDYEDAYFYDNFEFSEGFRVDDPAVLSIKTCIENLEGERDAVVRELHVFFDNLNSSSAYFRWAVLLCLLDKPREAIQLVMRLLEKKVEGWNHINALSFALHKLDENSREKALDDLDKVFVDLDFPQAFGWWGSILQDFGKREKAVVAFRKASELPSFNYLNALCNLGRTGEAIEEVKEAIKSNPGYSPLLGPILQRLDETAQEKFISELHELAAELRNPVTHQKLGEALASQKPEDALIEFENAISRDRSFLPAYRSRVQILVNEKKSTVDDILTIYQLDEHGYSDCLLQQTLQNLPTEELSAASKRLLPVLEQKQNI